MLTTTLLSAILLLAPSTLAAPTPSSTPESKPWKVSNFTSGCSPGGCTYSFHIQSPRRKPFPSFNARCNGTDVQNELVECTHIKNGTLSANLIPTQKGLVLQVEQEFTAPIPGGEGRYWTDGFHQFKQSGEPKADFSIFPNQTYAVG